MESDEEELQEEEIPTTPEPARHPIVNVNPKPRPRPRPAYRNAAAEMAEMGPTRRSNRRRGTVEEEPNFLMPGGTEDVGN